MTAVRTAHRQMGSKARIAHQIAAMVPRDTTVWVEVFAGTAAATLTRQPDKSAEHINDRNGLIVNLYRVMRDPHQLDQLCRAVTLTPYAQAEFEASREIWNDPDAESLDPVERARRMLVASWQAIGGKQIRHASWRLDLGRSWLIPVWQGVPERLRQTAQRLMNCQIHNRHAFDMLDMFGANGSATLYLDPPYPRDSLATHEVLYAVDMDRAEHLDLIERLVRVKARVILSMSAHPLYDVALADAGWWSRDIPVRDLRNATKIERIHCNFRPAQDLLSALPPVED